MGGDRELEALGDGAGGVCGRVSPGVGGWQVTGKADVPASSFLPGEGTALPPHPADDLAGRVTSLGLRSLLCIRDS